MIWRYLKLYCNLNASMLDKCNGSNISRGDTRYSVVRIEFLKPVKINEGPTAATCAHE